MSLTVSAGELDLTNASNSFSGGVYITGGTLFAGDINGDLAGTTLGTGTVHLGSTRAATLTPPCIWPTRWGGTTYSQSIVVQSGNSGQAVIGLWDSPPRAPPWVRRAAKRRVPREQQPLERQRVRPRQRCLGAERRDQRHGQRELQRHRLGHLQRCRLLHRRHERQRRTAVAISGTSNTNTGNFNVSGGDLFIAGNGSLGNTANTVTLGSPGNFGGLGVWNGGTVINRAIT